MKYIKLIGFFLLLALVILSVMVLDSEARPTKLSRGSQMNAVTVLRDSTIDTLLVDPDDWALIAKLTGAGVLRPGQVDTNSLTDDMLTWLYTLADSALSLFDSASGLSDSSLVTGQISYRLLIRTAGGGSSPLIPSQRYAFIVDTASGGGSARLIVQDITGDYSYFIDSAATRSLIQSLTPASADSATVVGQLAYGFSIGFGTSFSSGSLVIDTVNGYLRWRDFSATPFVYGDTSWAGDRVDAAISSGNYWRSKRLVHQYVNPGLATVTGVGMPPCSLHADGGSIASGNGSNGPFILFTTGSTSTDSAGLETVAEEGGALSYTLTRSAWEPEFVARIQTGSSISSIKIWVGLFSTEEDAADPASTHLAGFRYVQGTDVYWTACTKDGSTLNTQVSSVQPAINSVYTFRIVLTATTADFYINDVFQKQLTANLPSSSQDMGFAVRVATGTSAAKTLYFDYASLLQK